MGKFILVHVSMCLKLFLDKLFRFGHNKGIIYGNIILNIFFFFLLTTLSFHYSRRTLYKVNIYPKIANQWKINNLGESFFFFFIKNQ